MADSQDYESWSEAKVREEASRRHIDASGGHRELVERLVADAKAQVQAAKARSWSDACNAYKGKYRPWSESGLGEEAARRRLDTSEGYEDSLAADDATCLWADKVHTANEDKEHIADDMFRIYRNKYSSWSESGLREKAAQQNLDTGGQFGHLERRLAADDGARFLEEKGEEEIAKQILRLQYNYYPEDELRQAAERRGLDTSGTSCVLVERLVKDDAAKISVARDGSKESLVQVTRNIASAHVHKEDNEHSNEPSIPQSHLDSQREEISRKTSELSKIKQLVSQLREDIEKKDSKLSDMKHSISQLQEDLKEAKDMRTKALAEVERLTQLIRKQTEEIT